MQQNLQTLTEPPLCSCITQIEWKSPAWKTSQSECNDRQACVGEQGNNEAILIGRISSGVRLIDLCSFCIGGQKGNNMLACIMALHESMSWIFPSQKATVKAAGIQSQKLFGKQKYGIQRLDIVNLGGETWFQDEKWYRNV